MFKNELDTYSERKGMSRAFSCEERKRLRTARALATDAHGPTQTGFFVPFGQLNCYLTRVPPGRAWGAELRAEDRRRSGTAKNKCQDQLATDAHGQTQTCFFVPFGHWAVSSRQKEPRNQKLQRTRIKIYWPLTDTDCFLCPSGKVFSP